MAPNTAMCFSLMGITLFLSHYLKKYKQHIIILRLLGILIFLLGVVAVIGYLTDLETAYGWSNLTRMAIHTSIGFIILGMGIIIQCGSQWTIKNLTKHLNGLYALVAAILIIFSILLWEELRTQEDELILKNLEKESLRVEEAIMKWLYF